MRRRWRKEGGRRPVVLLVLLSGEEGGRRVAAGGKKRRPVVGQRGGSEKGGRVRWFEVVGRSYVVGGGGLMWWIRGDNRSGGGFQGGSLNALKGLMSSLQPNRQQATLTSNLAEYQMYISYDYLRGISDEEVNNLDLLQWWRNKRRSLPVMSAISRDVLSIQVSSVASESCFSGANRILDDKRTRLRSETLKMLVCYKDWMDAEKRRQNEVDHESEIDSDQTSTESNA
ncbi:hypothetical protein KSS87_000414 [Heliosperma pusillum]|nr:hypothetical protein KSS87_000414 [Heliosperma pusillum]